MRLPLMFQSRSFRIRAVCMKGQNRKKFKELSLVCSLFQVLVPLFRTNAGSRGNYASGIASCGDVTGLWHTSLHSADLGQGRRTLC